MAAVSCFVAIFALLVIFWLHLAQFLYCKRASCRLYSIFTYMIEIHEAGVLTCFAPTELSMQLLQVILLEV